MNHEDPVRKALDAFEPLDPPASLRARTLRAAVAALGTSEPADLWTRLWESRPLRIAWATTVVALVIGNLAVPLHRSPGPVPAMVASPSPGEIEDPDLRSIAELPRIDLAIGPLSHHDDTSPSQASGRDEQRRAADPKENRT